MCTFVLHTNNQWLESYVTAELDYHVTCLSKQTHGYSGLLIWLYLHLARTFPSLYQGIPSFSHGKTCLQNFRWRFPETENKINRCLMSFYFKANLTLHVNSKANFRLSKQQPIISVVRTFLGECSTVLLYASLGREPLQEIRFADRGCWYEGWSSGLWEGALEGGYCKGGVQHSAACWENVRGEARVYHMTWVQV